MYNAAAEAADRREMERQRRETLNPDPLHAAVLAELRERPWFCNDQPHANGCAAWAHGECDCGADESDLERERR